MTVTPLSFSSDCQPAVDLVNSNQSSARFLAVTAGDELVLDA
jgi:hypothetical protein